MKPSRHPRRLVIDDGQVHEIATRVRDAHAQLKRSLHMAQFQVKDMSIQDIAFLSASLGGISADANALMQLAVNEVAQRQRLVGLK